MFFLVHLMNVLTLLVMLVNGYSLSHLILDVYKSTNFYSILHIKGVDLDLFSVSINYLYFLLLFVIFSFFYQLSVCCRFKVKFNFKSVFTLWTDELHEFYMVLNIFFLIMNLFLLVFFIHFYFTSFNPDLEYMKVFEYLENMKIDYFEKPFENLYFYKTYTSEEKYACLQRLALNTAKYDETFARIIRTLSDEQINKFYSLLPKVVYDSGNLKAVEWHYSNLCRTHIKDLKNIVDNKH